MPQCMECGELRFLEELYPNKGICETCINCLVPDTYSKDYPKSPLKDRSEPMSINHLGDNAAAWLLDEPWRTW